MRHVCDTCRYFESMVFTIRCITTGYREKVYMFCFRSEKSKQSCRQKCKHWKYRWR